MCVGMGSVLRALARRHNAYASINTSATVAAPAYPPALTALAVEMCAQVESVFAMFLSDPVLALVRLFGLDATPELVEALQGAVEHTLERAHAAVAADLPVPDGSFAGDGSGTSVLCGPWCHVLLDLFAQRLVLRFALCRAVFARLAGAAPSKDGADGSGFRDAGPTGADGAAVGKHSQQLPRALPDLPAGLAPSATDLAHDVDVLLRTVCKVDVYGGGLDA